MAEFNKTLSLATALSGLGGFKWQLVFKSKQICCFQFLFLLYFWQGGGGWVEIHLLVSYVCWFSVSNESYIIYPCFKW